MVCSPCSLARFTGSLSGSQDAPTEILLGSAFVPLEILRSFVVVAGLVFPCFWVGSLLSLGLALAGVVALRLRERNGAPRSPN